jgi:hypothetical protein
MEQELIQRFFAAVERFPIVLLSNRFSVPCGHRFECLTNARAAARILAFGAGGFSSRSRTRRLSLPESRRWSASAMTVLTALLPADTSARSQPIFERIPR